MCCVFFFRLFFKDLLLMSVKMVQAGSDRHLLTQANIDYRRHFRTNLLIVFEKAQSGYCVEDGALTVALLPRPSPG